MSKVMRMTPEEHESSLGEVLELLGERIRYGFRHGFFDYSVSCELISGKKRRIVVRAGISDQFIIPESGEVEQ